MQGVDLFFDSSALMSGILSAKGASRALLVLVESGVLEITISEQVLVETERAIARKAPWVLGDFRQAILASKARIVRDPAPEEVAEHTHLISHEVDVPILLATMQVKTDYLVTLNSKHFSDDPSVALNARIRIGTPGEALKWVRGKMGGE